MKTSLIRISSVSIRGESYFHQSSGLLCSSGSDGSVLGHIEAVTSAFPGRILATDEHGLARMKRSLIRVSSVLIRGENYCRLNGRITLVDKAHANSRDRRGPSRGGPNTTAELTPRHLRVGSPAIQLLSARLMTWSS
jgi:hypothetical protein